MLPGKPKKAREAPGNTGKDCEVTGTLAEILGKRKIHKEHEVVFFRGRSGKQREASGNRA